MANTKNKAKAKGPSKNGKKPKKKPFKCKDCGKSFSDRYNLSSHALIHTDETFPCPLCPYIGNTKKYLARHNRQVHQERNQHKCTYCGKSFLHPNNLRDHIMVHTGEKPLSCNVCGKSFRVSYSLNTHMLIHADEKPFRCSFCDYCCRDSSTLRKHQNKHMGIQSVYQCKICSKGYKSKVTLKMHVSEAHLDVDLKKVPCGQCDRLFKTVSQRTAHVKLIHKRALVCTCPVCGTRLASKYNMSEHMRRHMDERPFACKHPGCALAFKNKSCLLKHSKIHLPPPFECSQCGRKFVRKTHARQHEMTMHAARTRSVECDYCGVKFFSKTYLLKHIQIKHIHKHKFKYTCDICGLTTHNKPSIVMHLKYGHLNDDDLQCKLCDNKVVYKKHAYLKLHYWKTHNVKYKIDARRATRANREQSNKNVQIKVEPIDEESSEEMELLDVQKMEQASEDDNESLDYSKQVLSEDITALVLRDRNVEGKEVDFDDFYIKHIMAKQEEKPDVPKSYYGVNKEQDLYVKRTIKNILLRTQKQEKAQAEHKKKKEEERLRQEKEEEEARMREEAERQEIVELRRVRELYNEKMKAAAEREKRKKDKVNIKYFKKPEVNKTVNVIDDDDDLDKESTVNDTTRKSANNDIIDDTDDNTPLNGLITKINTEVDSTNSKDVSNLKKNSDNSTQIDGNVNLNTIEKDPTGLDENNIEKDPTELDKNNIEKDPTELDKNNIDTDDMDIDEDLNTGNIVFIEGNTFINNHTVSQLANTNDIELSGNGDRVKSTEASLNKNYANFENLEQILGCESNYTYQIIIRNDNEENKYEVHVIDKNQQTYVKNNNADNITQDKQTQQGITDNEIMHEQANAIITENVIQQSNVDSNDIGVRDDEKSDDEVINNDSEDINSDNELSKSDSDSDFDKPLIKCKKKSKKDLDYELDKDVCQKKAKKMEFKTHQCYVCFKLYQTKEQLLNHCQEHFDICNERTLGKCPICNQVTFKVAQHMRRSHKINIKVPKLKNRKTKYGSKYCYEINGGEIEVIPSIKGLNKNASMEIDKKRREKKDKVIARKKLVKKGTAWIVENEYLDLKYDELPELTDIELTKCKVTGNDVDRLGQISRIAKKKGLKMMFPCFECDKVCLNFSGIKLHKRRHEANPKPFAARIKNGARSVKKESKIKLNKGNRTALPKPINTNHKCDEKLKKFFESNIRGGDIEFWQFLKIYNKMDREKINDFKDLEKRNDFGNHLDYYKDDDNDEMFEMAQEIDKYIEGNEDSEIDDNEISDEVIAVSGDDDDDT